MPEGELPGVAAEDVPGGAEVREEHTLIRTSRKYFGQKRRHRTSSTAPRDERARYRAALPKRPSGRRSRTTTKITNTTSCFSEPGRKVAPRDSASPTMKPPAKRAEEVAHPAQHHDHEGHEVEGLADVGRHVEERGDERARHRGAGRADAEGDRADPAHVDTHEKSALGLLGERADRLADVGGAEKGEQADGDEGGAAAGDEAWHLDERVADDEGGARHRRPDRAEVALPEHERQVLQEQREPQREEELVVLRGPAVGLDDHLLDDRRR